MLSNAKCTWLFLKKKLLHHRLERRSFFLFLLRLKSNCCYQSENSKIQMDLGHAAHLLVLFFPWLASKFSELIVKRMVELEIYSFNCSNFRG